MSAPSEVSDRHLAPREDGPAARLLGPAPPAQAPSEVSDRHLGFLWGAVALLLILLSPLATSLAGGLMSCPFKGVTGIPCPTCGTTRAALALAHLEPAHALAHYPLPALGWILFLGGGLAAGWRAWRGLPLPRIPRNIPIWARLAFLGTVLANWAYSIATGV